MSGPSPSSPCSCGSSIPAVAPCWPTRTWRVCSSGMRATSPTVGFAETHLAVEEAAQRAIATVQRQGSPVGAVSVSYAVHAGTAAVSDDYRLPAGNLLSWRDGDATPRTIVIPIVRDAVDEIAERFEVRLSSPSGATLGDATLGVTVNADATGLALTEDQSRLAGRWGGPLRDSAGHAPGRHRDGVPERERGSRRFRGARAAAVRDSGLVGGARGHGDRGPGQQRERFGHDRTRCEWRRIRLRHGFPVRDGAGRVAPGSGHRIGGRRRTREPGRVVDRRDGRGWIPDTVALRRRVLQRDRSRGHGVRRIDDHPYHRRPDARHALHRAGHGHEFEWG